MLVRTPTVYGLRGFRGAAACHQLLPGVQVCAALLLHADEVVQLLHHRLLSIGQLRGSNAIRPGLALKFLDEPAASSCFSR